VQTTHSYFFTGTELNRFEVPIGRNAKFLKIGVK